ncbi:MAG: hydantoinase B/oxoprolinase family protein [Solirubrobacteraceae bacterium]|nr:hydantoinase B/oxoprolinase family protein [Solirubrobacteraceae bacterium]
MSITSPQNAPLTEELEQLDAVQMAVIQSRLEASVRAMINTLLRSARSGILAVARDFSCCILTADHELLAWAESIPIHVMRGPDIISRHIKEWHPDFKRGDAFLHNSPYHGNSHAADWCLLIPVIDDEGVHRFTVFAKAHQGDCGNSEPTTYAFNARDVYEEGALIFPGVQVQENYVDNEDIIRMCKMRIRVPDQWWGDYLALMGSARIGERRMLELIDDIGAEKLAAYSKQWFDLSEQKMVDAIKQLPKGSKTVKTKHDGFPRLPEGVPLQVTVSVDPDEAKITVDLKDNPDCVPAGINLSEGCANSSAMIGVFNSLGPDVPANAGSFRRLDVQLREGCCVGIPTHPYSVSAATTNLQDRVCNITQHAMAEMKDGVGMAEYGYGVPPSGSVISGHDPRTGEPFINQIQLAVTLGPGGPNADGWVTAYTAGGAGMMYKDSIEIDEIKHPFRVTEQRLLTDTAGDGRFRGSPGALVRMEAVGTPITFMTNSDGIDDTARGVRGGTDGAIPAQWIEKADGEVVEIDAFHRLAIKDGETMVSICGGGAGYGPPYERELALVRRDTLDGWISRERAADVYGVIFEGDELGEGVIDEAATAAKRAELATT